MLDTSRAEYSAPIDNSEYVEESGLVLDYNRNNNIVAVELISSSKRLGKDYRRRGCCYLRLDTKVNVKNQTDQIDQIDQIDQTDEI